MQDRKHVCDVILSENTKYSWW